MPTEVSVAAVGEVKLMMNVRVVFCATVIVLTSVQPVFVVTVHEKLLEDELMMTRV